MLFLSFPPAGTTARAVAAATMASCPVSNASRLAVELAGGAIRQLLGFGLQVDAQPLVLDSSRLPQLTARKIRGTLENSR